VEHILPSTPSYHNISHWNAALIPHFTPLCYGHRLSNAPWFKSPYRFVPLNVIIFLSHHTVTTRTLKSIQSTCVKQMSSYNSKLRQHEKKLTGFRLQRWHFYVKWKIAQNMIGFSLKQLETYENYTRGKEYRITWYDMIHLLTSIGLTPGGSSTVHIYTQTIHRTTTTKNKQYIEQHKKTIHRTTQK
jgi:hypothetical protein